MEKKIVPTPSHRNEAVLIPVNFNGVEIGASLINLFGNKRKTRMALILAGLLFLAGSSLFAEEAVKAEETVKTGETIKKENVFKQIASIQGRGAMNFLTAPGEFSAAFQTEKKAHPKAWLLTYPPRFFSNMAVRVGSSVNDILVLPWFVRWSEDTPLTKRFELPDYVWEKE